MARYFHGIFRLLRWEATRPASFAWAVGRGGARRPVRSVAKLLPTGVVADAPGCNAGGARGAGVRPSRFATVFAFDKVPRMLILTRLWLWVYRRRHLSVGVPKTSSRLVGS